MIRRQFYSTSTLALIIFLIAGCQPEELIRTNPFDADYDINTGVGDIVGYSALDQRSDRADIFVELRASSEVPTSYGDIANRNDDVPSNWSDLTMPSMGSGGSEAYTDSEGRYDIVDVPVGHYVLRVSKAGFNTAWLTNIEVIKDGTIRIPETTVLTEQVDGKILFISQRDGFAEFYQMESDGTQQERLTFDGILSNAFTGVLDVPGTLDLRDDDIPFQAIDFNPVTRQAVYLAFNEIFIFDYDSRTSSYLFSDFDESIFASDVCWGPDGSIYVADGEAIWKITDPDQPLPIMIYPQLGELYWSNINTLDVSSDGRIAFIEEAFVYALDDGLIYQAAGENMFTKVDILGNVIYSSEFLPDADWFRVPFLIPLDQVKVMEDDNSLPVVRYSGLGPYLTLPFLPYDDPYEIVQTDYVGNKEFIRVVTEVLFDGPAYFDTSIYAYNPDDLRKNLGRANAKWGIEWSQDGSQITYCDIYAESPAYSFEWVYTDDYDSFDATDPSTYESFPDGGQEESYFQINRLGYPVTTIDVSIYGSYFGSESEYTYAYDSYQNFGTSQPIWSAGVLGDEKIIFVRGLEQITDEWAGIGDVFSWQALDIWSMDATNVDGAGPMKQLTTDPNKDFLPIWVP